MASGHRQSPVNINKESTTRGRSFKAPLTWRYVPENTKSLINPGYCWRVDVNGEGSSLSGGPLSTDVFQLEQFHCHVSKYYSKTIFLKKKFQKIHFLLILFSGDAQTAKVNVLLDLII